jgi:hypothetical protein
MSDSAICHPPKSEFRAAEDLEDLYEFKIFWVFLQKHCCENSCRRRAT